MINGYESLGVVHRLNKRWGVPPLDTLDILGLVMRWRLRYPQSTGLSRIAMNPNPTLPIPSQPQLTVAWEPTSYEHHAMQDLHLPRAALSSHVSNFGFSESLGLRCRDLPVRMKYPASRGGGVGTLCTY